MSKLSLLYIVKLTLLVVFFAFILDKIVYYGINEVAKKVYTGRIGKVNQFLNVKNDLDFIVFGSSRANHHINTEKIHTKSFNMGLDATEIAFAATLIKNLPQDKSQLVLLHFSAQSCFIDSYDGNDINKLSMFLHQNQIVKNEMTTLNKNSPIQKFFFSQVYNGYFFGIVKNYFISKYNFRPYSGYDPIMVSSQQKKIFQNQLKSLKKNECKNNLAINDIYLKYIREIRDFCKENNKKLIFFTSPIYEDNCKNDDRKIKNILENEDITYWNYTDFFESDKSLKNWKDNTHLSHIGAEIFTKEIHNRLKENKLLPE